MHLETKICRRCRKPYMSEYTESEMCKKCENLVSIVKHGIRLKHCVVCDKPFEMKSNNSRYCSKECKKEAIKASHETLGVMARKAQRSFGTSILNVGYLASCLRDDYPYLRSEVYRTKVKWEPVFVPDASTLSLIGDGTIKINQALDGYITKDVLHDLTGIKGGNDE